jgi:hypothetical protein
LKSIKADTGLDVQVKARELMTREEWVRETKEQDPIRKVMGGE